jgi:hypothetical protein
MTSADIVVQAFTLTSCILHTAAIRDPTRVRRGLNSSPARPSPLGQPAKRSVGRSLSKSPPAGFVKAGQQQLDPTSSAMKVSLTKGKVDGQGRGLGLEESLVVQPTNVPTPTEQPPHQPTLYQAWASPDMSNRVAKPGCRRNPSNQIQEAAAPETVLHPGLRCRQSHAATDPVSMSHRPPEPSTTPRFQRTRDDPPPLLPRCSVAERPPPEEPPANHPGSRSRIHPPLA